MKSTSLLVDVILWTVVFCVAYGVSYLLVPIRFKHKEVEIMDLIFSFPYYLILSGLAFWSTWELGGERENRLYGVTLSSYFCLLFYACGNIAHIPVTLWKKQASSYKVLMLCHHIASICCFLVGLKEERFIYFGCLCVCCEFSTFMLNLVFILKEFNFSSGIITVIGVLLWVSYFTLRLMLFPYWLHLYWTEVLVLEDLSFVERYMNFGTTLMLLGLSCWWMVALTKGMLKALKSSPSGGDISGKDSDGPGGTPPAGLGAGDYDESR